MKKIQGIINCNSILGEIALQYRLGFWTSKMVSDRQRWLNLIVKYGGKNKKSRSYTRRKLVPWTPKLYLDENVLYTSPIKQLKGSKISVSSDIRRVNNYLYWPLLRLYENMALTKASASKGWRSSTPSPTPTNFTGMPSSSTTLTCNKKLQFIDYQDRLKYISK